MGRVIKAYMIKPVGPTEPCSPLLKRDTTAAYGKHLVMTIANCNECHTKRDGIGNYVGEPLAGGSVFEEKGMPTLITPNLTPDSSSRIFGWSQDDFIKRFRLGRVIPYSHMPWESFGRMTDDELKAIYKYLRTLKPVRTTDYKKCCQSYQYLVKALQNFKTPCQAAWGFEKVGYNDTLLY